MTDRSKNLVSFVNKLPTTFVGAPILPPDFSGRLRTKDELDDFEFDQILPPRYRFVAETHWTSIQAARMIADQIGSKSNQRFVDVGSGVGKLCVLLSLLTEMEIFGVEQRLHLHEVAEEIVRANSISRVNLSHGNMTDIDWDNFDIFFFFNPFQELNFKFDIFAIDHSVSPENGLYVKYVRFIEDRIKDMPAGKRLIALDGFGGTIPQGWRLVSSDRILDSTLNHWIKVT